MARLCVRVAEKYAPGDPNSILGTNPGDVVCIVDDDHKFSDCEMLSGQYRIIDMPGIPQDKLIYLCEHAEDADGAMIRRRVRTIALAADLKLPELPKDAATAALTRDQLLKQADAALQAGDKQAYLDLLAQADAADKQPELVQYTDAVLSSVAAVTIDKPVVKADPALSVYAVKV